MYDINEKTLYMFDGSKEYCFFYAHLDHYAKNLHEGQEVQKGDVIGYVWPVVGRRARI